jgi:plasmid replication initiation protein
MDKRLTEILTDVKKPVEAIQCANTFSLIQRKMYNVLLANAANNLRSDVTHRISMGTLCKLMGYDSKDYKSIKDKFRELRRMDIEWDIINEQGNKVWTNTSPLSLARVIEGKGICEYEFTASLIPLLSAPAQYAKFSLGIQSKFQSSYGLALYENCERYRNIGQTRNFDVLTFRKLMGVHEHQYKDFFALKRRVIVIAIKEVNKHSDFEITPEYEKNGRQVVRIRFLISNKKKILTQISSSKQNEDGVSKILADVFRLSEKEINNYLKNYTSDYLNEKIQYVLNTPSFQSGSIKNVGGYLKTAIKSDYQKSISSSEIIVNSKREAEESVRQDKIIKDAIHNAKRSYESFILNSLLRVLKELAPTQSQAIIDEFSEYLQREDQITFKMYIRSKFKSAAVGVSLKGFIKNNYQDIFSQFSDFSNYVREFHPDLIPYLKADNHGG